MKTPCVYIICNRPFGTLYVGVTSNLSQRMSQHIHGIHNGFTKRYKIRRLVYYEMHQTMPEAIVREKQLKRWHRTWKYRLIATMNPEWQDLLDRDTGAVHFGPSDVERVGKA